jgi:thymidine phosphorylase
MSAFLMAVYFQGLSAPELAALVDVMLRSGAVADHSDIGRPPGPKHNPPGRGPQV